MTYDGKEWVTVLEEEMEDSEDTIVNDCIFIPNRIDGLTLDNQNRVWTWKRDVVKILEGDKWIELTPENSGFNGSVVSILMDDLDRVWIVFVSHYPDGGVSMANVNDIKPVSAMSRNQNKWFQRLTEYLKGGMGWYFASLIAILWIATYNNVLPGVLIAVVLGSVATFLNGTPIITGALGDYINPGVIGTYLGVLGGMVGKKYDLFLAIIGVIFGTVLTYILYILPNF